MPQNAPSGTVTPAPGITFEDLGVVVKITPHVHDAASVTLEFEAEYTQLTGNTSDGLPIIASRKFTMPIRMSFGQSAVIAGLVQRERLDVHQRPSAAEPDPLAALRDAQPHEQRHSADRQSEAVEPAAGRVPRAGGLDRHRGPRVAARLLGPGRASETPGLP